MVVHVGSTESERLRSHLFAGRACAIEVVAKVMRGRVTHTSISVNKNPPGTRLKLAPLPVQPEQEVYPQAGAQAWGGAFQPGFSPQAAASAGAAGGAPHNDLGPGGVRFRLLPNHTNNFEPGDYYLTWNAVAPGSLLVQVQALVEQTPGQGLQPLQVVTHQQRLIPDLIPDVSINWGNKNQPPPVNQFGQTAVPPQQQQQHQQPLAPRGPYGQQPAYNSQAPYSPSAQMSHQDALLHIRNLERELADQNAEIHALKKANRGLDEKLYNYERGRGGLGGSSGASELQLSRYKEYILKAKEVIAQQKERIVDLETTTMVGRLEAHLLEYREYASRQKLKLAELSQDLEGVDQEVRELRDEAEELRARYEALKAKSADRAIREEPSPRRTPHYSRQRSVTGSLAASGQMRLPGGTYDLASPGPYSHEAALLSWEREGLRAPKTPTAGSAYGRDNRDPYAREGYARDGDYSRDSRDVRARGEDVRREHEREWAREYERAHGYPAAPGANPYSLPPPAGLSSPSPAANLYASHAYGQGARHRNAATRAPRPGATRHYYDRYGSVTDLRERAAMRIQAAWRGFRQRRKHRRTGSSSSSSYGRKSTTTHVPADHRASSTTTSRPASSTVYGGGASSSSAYSSSRKQLAPVSSSRPASSTSYHRSSTASRKHYTREEEDRAARKIQSSYRNHLSRKRSSSSHHRSGSTHKSSSSSHRSGTSSREKEREREREREREKERERERERERDREREGRTRYGSSSKRH
jgi:hypothetical protein